MHTDLGGFRMGLGVTRMHTDLGGFRRIGLGFRIGLMVDFKEVKMGSRKTPKQFFTLNSILLNPPRSVCIRVTPNPILLDPCASVLLLILSS